MDIVPVNQQFGEFIGNILNYAMLLAGSGTLAMALIEGWKGLRSSKARFHQRVLREWVRLRYSEAHADGLDAVRVSLAAYTIDELELMPYESVVLGSFDDSEEEEEATAESKWATLVFSQLESLCNGLDAKAPAPPKTGFSISDELAFYSLHTEQVIAKVQRSLESVLQDPVRSPDLFMMLAAQHPHSAGRWLAYLLKEKNEPDAVTTNDRTQALHYQGLLLEMLSNKLDSFQTNALYAWGRGNRFASMMVGAAILLVFFSIYLPQLGAETIILFSSLGGIVSPVAKNLVTALRGISLK